MFPFQEKSTFEKPNLIRVKYFFSTYEQIRSSALK